MITFLLLCLFFTVTCAALARVIFPSTPARRREARQ